MRHEQIKHLSRSSFQLRDLPAHPVLFDFDELMPRIGSMRGDRGRYLGGCHGWYLISYMMRTFLGYWMRHLGWFLPFNCLTALCFGGAMVSSNLFVWIGSSRGTKVVGDSTQLLVFLFYQLFLGVRIQWTQKFVVVRSICESQVRQLESPHVGRRVVGPWSWSC